MSEPEATTAPVTKSWKQRLGMGLIIYSFIPICTVELVAFLDVSSTFAVTFGAIYLASGEIAFLAAVALLGKQFVKDIKNRVKGFFFRPKEPGKPKPISRLRHGVGVALFFLSIVPYYATMGILFWAHPKEPDLRTLLYLLVAGEALFFVSLFVLGEEFWARLKRLFEWPGKEVA